MRSVLWWGGDGVCIGSFVLLLRSPDSTSREQRKDRRSRKHQRKCGTPRPRAAACRHFEHDIRPPVVVEEQDQRDWGGKRGKEIILPPHLCLSVKDITLVF